MQKRQFYLFLK